MAFGLTRSAVETDLARELKAAANGLAPEQVEHIARAVAAAIDRNNREIERELGRKFANIERMIGR